MSKKQKNKNIDQTKSYSLPEQNKAETALKNFFSWIASNRKLILWSFLGLIVIIAAIVTYNVISKERKYKIATEFFNANKEYAEKLKKRVFDLNSVGNTMKKLRKITEMSSSVEEALIARYFLGILHFNVARSENKLSHYIKAKDYWVVVAEHEDFAFAPQALLAIGTSYEELNKNNFYRRAIEFYNIVIKRYPNTIFSNRAFYKKAICYVKMNKKDLAVATFKKIPKYLGNDASSRRENLYYSMAQNYIIFLNS